MPTYNTHINTQAVSDHARVLEKQMRDHESIYLVCICTHMPTYNTRINTQAVSDHARVLEEQMRNHEYTVFLYVYMHTHI